MTLFASNVARLESVALAARDAGREPVLVGRSLHRYVRAARACGYLEDVRLLTEDEGAQLHNSQVLYLCTGCQGEPRAAMARIASDSHPRVSLFDGDTVIFSSKIIPGNERTIADLHNRLLRRGIEVITEKDAGVHVSGHPCRGELRQMYQWIRPQIAVPVHGEARHMQAHGALARALQVPEPVFVENGDLLRLAPGPAAVIGRAPAGRLALDGENIVATDHVSIGARRKLMHNGAIFVSVVVDRSGRTLVSPLVSGRGNPGRGRPAGGAGGDCGGRGRRGGLADAGAGARRERDRGGGAACYPARAAREPRQAPDNRCADRARAGMSGEAMRGARP